MAEQPYSTSRREIFGIVATAAIGVSIGVPALAQSGSVATGIWDRAYRSYRAADDEMRQHDLRHYTPAAQRHLAWRSQWPMKANVDDVPALKAGWAAQSALYDPIEARHDELVDIRDAAAAALIATPAPTIGAIVTKMEILIKDDGWEDNDAGAKLCAILADLRRLGGH